MAKELFLVEPQHRYVNAALTALIEPNQVRERPILIKPNVRSPATPEEGKTTHPRVLSMLLDFLKRNYSNSNIMVCDSSIVGFNTIISAQVSGILEICETNDVEFIDLRERGYIRYSIPIEPYQIELTELLSLNPYLINVPKLKTTWAVPLAVSAKNLKGLLSDRSKRDFHRYGLNRLLAQLARLVNPHLTLVDGVYSRSLSTPIRSNIILISRLFVELDAFLSEEIGIPWQENEYLRLIFAQKDPLEGVIKRSLGEVQDLRSLGFQMVNYNVVEGFTNVKIVGHPCCGCLGCVSKALLDTDVHAPIVIFCGVAGEAESFNKEQAAVNYLSIGNCTTVVPGVIHVPGCPPTITSIEQAIREATGQY